MELNRRFYELNQGDPFQLSARELKLLLYY